MLIEKRFNTGEVVLNYAEGPPNGPPLLLNHGFTNNWRFYQPIIPYLQTRWQIIAPDLRGHGKSSKTPEQYGLGYYYQDLQNFLDEKHIEPIVLVGHSLGGVLSSMLASRNRGKVRGLVLLDPPIFIRRTDRVLLPKWETFYMIAQNDDTVQDRIKYIESLNIETDKGPVKFTNVFSSSYVYDWAQNHVDPSILGEMIKAQEDEGVAARFYSWYNPEAVLRLIDCPVLLLQAGKGGTILDYEIEQVKDWVNDLVHIKLENLEHDLGFSSWHPSEALRPISHFLESMR